MAEQKQIEQKVKDIIVEQLGVNADQLTSEAKFIEDLGADSLDIVELVMALEEEFSQEIPTWIWRSANLGTCLSAVWAASG